MISIEEFSEAVKKHGIYSCDVEHDAGANLYNGEFKIWGASFGVPKIDTAVSAKIQADEIHSFYLTDLDLVKKYIAAAEQHNPRCINHNIKHDIKCIWLSGLADRDFPKRPTDTMIGYNLIDDNLHPNMLGLKKLVQSKFGEARLEYKEAVKYGRDSERFYKYACDDANDVIRLFCLIEPDLEHQGLLAVYDKIYNAAIKVFADMEISGFAFDLIKARELLHGFRTLRDSLEEQIIAQIGPINLNSPKQLSSLLFDTLKMSTEGVRKTKTGFSVDADTIELLARKNPIIAKISDYRTAAKLLSTYVVAFTELALEDNHNRIHPSVWLLSATGRTRMNEPNLQNIPVAARAQPFIRHLDIRSAFIAEDSWDLIVADLSQIELRLFGHIADEKIFIKNFCTWICRDCDSQGLDTTILHKCPKCGAKENEKILKDINAKGFWHGGDLHQITSTKIAALNGDRNAGKVSNFAIIYNALPKKMNFLYPEFSIEEWSRAIYEFKCLYPGVPRYHDRIEALVSTRKYCTDIFGRRRRVLHGFTPKSPGEKKHLLNQMVNFPCQASGCGLALKGLNDIRDDFMSRGTWLKDIHFINFVHDENVFRVKKEYAEEAKEVIQHHMEHCIQLKVPLRADIKIVNRWSEAK